VTVEYRLQEVAMPAAHVADAPVPGEVVRVQVGNPSAGVQLGDPGLAGADGVIEVAQGVPAERRAGHASEGAQ